MPHLEAYDYGSPILLTDFTGQSTNFAQNISPDAANIVWTLINRLVQNGVLAQGDLDAMLVGAGLGDEGEYTIAIVD